MDKPLLNDPKERPDDQVLARYLGKSKPAWDAFAAGTAERFSDVSLEWRYYNDGKAWLCKVVRKKKTVCWVSVWDKFFRTVFYFTAEHDADIEALPIAADLKAQYQAHDPIGKLKPLIVPVKTRKELESVFAVMTYKISLG